MAAHLETIVGDARGCLTVDNAVWIVEVLRKWNFGVCGPEASLNTDEPNRVEGSLD